MAPWLIITTGWPAVTAGLAAALARAAADPATVAVVGALLLGGAVLLRLHSRERRDRRSTS